MKIAVLLGGISTERNVSIAGGKAIVEALKSRGHDALAIDPSFGAESLEKSKELLTDLSKFPDINDLEKFPTRNYIDCINSPIFDDIDVAFIVLHGTNGEDGLIQSLLHLRGIPYTGSEVKASSAAMDKNFSKMIFAAAGINTPQWTIVSKNDEIDIELAKDIKGFLGKKLVIKPNNQGSTIGITIINDGDPDSILQAIEYAHKYSETAVIEQFIEGREITVGIIGNQALPIIEIVPEEGFYDYQAKYTKGKTSYLCPADISPDIAEFTFNVALNAHHALGCSGFSRVDFILTNEGVPVCLEVNTIPGFTATSLVPMAAKEIGIEFPELCEKIIDLSISKHKPRVNND